MRVTLRAVATARADAYIGNLNNANYLIKQYNFQNITVAAPTPFGDHSNAMAVRKDWAELASLLNKGLDSITPSERQAIAEKWGAVEVRARIDYRLAWQVGIAATILILLILLWNIGIRRQQLALGRSELQLLQAHQATAELNAELQKNTMILNEGQQLASIGGWSFDVANKVIWWTDELFALHGLPVDRDDLRIQSKAAQSINCYAPEQREQVMQSFQKAIVDAQGYDLENYFTRYDGKQIWVRNVGKPILENGKVVRVIGTLMDISKHKRIQQELEAARDAAQAANQAKSRFLANMSHELRTPLNAILGFSQLLARDEALKPAQRSKLDTTNRAGEHLLAMINEVLEMLMLHDIAEMFRFRATQRDVRFALELNMPPDCAVHADQGKLRQVLFNLLGNALKFTRWERLTSQSAKRRSRFNRLRRFG